MEYQKLTNFKLNAFYPYVPQLRKSVETGIPLHGIFDWIDAKVPGSIHKALLDAKIIRDPYFEMQSMESEWVKDRWWEYKISFIADEVLKNKNLRLRLNGIDYKAHIKLNGQLLGVHEGMYVPFVHNITDFVKTGSDNDISIILESAPDEMGQIGYTEKTFTQKARFTYKWDWCPRLVQLGLYDDVILEYFGDVAINHSYIRPVLDKNVWKLENGFEVEAFNDTTAVLKFKLSYENEQVIETRASFDLKKGNNSISHVFPVENPRQWFPNGHGGQPLYNLEVTVYDENGESDFREYNVGFRTISYVQCDEAQTNSLPYNIVINGKRIYIKGVNISPLDVMYGSIENSYYEKTIQMAKEANINLIRVWGGGLIEKEIFYNLCDKSGIMVWQEFIQSSSGINNVPSKRTDFLSLAKNTAIEAVKVKRNHVCLAYWSGGNELTDHLGVPATFDDENIKMLKEIVNEFDKDRLMLPTSASGPLEFLDIKKPKENHDVHGPWKYCGVEGQYETYNMSDSQLHSEFGVDGMTNYDSLCSVMSASNRFVKSMNDNIFWRHHGEWWDTLERDSIIFGKFGQDEIHEFIMCSQFIQAEGIRYALEANRRRMFENCGSIIWQFNEPWPNVAGTNVLDYYCKPKLAYHFLSKAYEPTVPNIKYEKLLYEKNEKFKAHIFINNDAAELMDIISCIATDQEGNIIFNNEQEVAINENKTTMVSAFEFIIPETDSFVVSLQLKNIKTSNNYLFLTKNKQGLAQKSSVIKFFNWFQNNCI